MLNFSRSEKALGKTKHCKKEAHYVVSKQTNGQTTTSPIDLTPELGYFIGFFLGDGGLKDTRKTFERNGKREYKITVGGYSEEFTGKIQRLCSQLFGPTPPLRFERETKGIHYDYINPTSKAVFPFLTQVIGLGNRKTREKVPESIMAAPIEIRQWFLRGYFDAEGSIDRKYKRKMHIISVHAKEHVLLEQIQAMLAAVFDVNASRLYREKNASKLFVTHQADVAKLLEKGLFTHPNKVFFQSPL